MIHGIQKWRGPALAVLLVILAGGWHFLDTRAGVMESGDGWLLRLYLGLFAWVLLILGFTAVCLLGRRLRLELCVFLSVLLLGCAYLVTLPPLSSPDEIAHFASSYGISNRLLGMEAEDGDGHVYLRREDEALSNIYGATGEEERISLGRLLDEETWKFLAAHGSPVFTDQAGREMVPSVISTVKTTPMAYVPQAIGITLARLLGLNCVYLAFLGRLMNLLLFAGMTALSVHFIPAGKLILYGTALLPMSLHLAASLSYDAFVMSGCFFFGSYCMYLAYAKPKVEKRDIAALSVTIALLGPCKIVYAVVLGFALLIPVKKFGGWKPWALSALAVFVSFLGAMVLVNSQIIAGYAAGTDTYVTWAAEEGYSLPFILHNPLRYMRMVYETVTVQGGELFLTMLGSRLGNLDAVLSVPFFILAGLTACLVGMGIRSAGEALYVTAGQKLWLLFLAGACLLGLMTAMLIALTPLSAGSIAGVQGRYLLPLLPFVVLTLKNDRLVRTAGSDERLVFYMCAMNGYVVLRLFSIVSMRL